MTDKKRVDLYTRVSTQEQTIEGYSLDAQLARLTAYAESQGWTIHNIYSDEGISAKNMERPALQQMLDDVRNRRVDIVLVYKLDRLSRNIVDLNELLNEFDIYNVGFKSATELFDTTSAIGRLFINIVAAMAQWERENLAERTRMGLVEMTNQGKWSGGKPAFGYHYENGMLHIYEPAAKVVREIFKRYTSGVGTTTLLNWLNNPDKPQLAPNKRWTQWSLKYILRNPLYAGLVRFGYRNRAGHRQQDCIIVDGRHDAIIPKALFERAEMMRMKRRTEPGHSSKGNYPLTSVIRCGRCGSAMNGKTKYRTNKNDSPPRRYYMCNERSHSMLCDMPRVKADDIEHAVLEQLKSYYEQIPVEVEPVQEHMNIDISTELAKLRERKARWMKAYDEGAIGISDLREQNAMIDREEIQLRSLLDEEKPIDTDKIREMMSTLYESWNAMEPHARKEAVQMIIERIVVNSKDEILITYKI